MNEEIIKDQKAVFRISCIRPALLIPPKTLGDRKSFRFQGQSIPERRKQFVFILSPEYIGLGVSLVSCGDKLGNFQKVYHCISL